MEIFKELKKITDTEVQVKVLKTITYWYDYGTIGPVVPKNNIELKNFIDKCLREEGCDYGSIVDINVRIDAACMMCRLEDAIFIGHYQAVIDHYEHYLKLNCTEEEILTEHVCTLIKFLKIPNAEKIKRLLNIYEKTEDHFFIKEIYLILNKM